LAQLRERLQRARSETDVFNMDRLARDVQDHLFAITGVPIPQPGEFSSERGGKTEAADAGETFKPLSAELRQRNRDVLGIRPDEFVWINLAARTGDPELEALLLRFAARKKVQPNLRLIIQAGGSITELVARYPNVLAPGVLASMLDVPFELTPEKRCALYSMADVYVAGGGEGNRPFESEAQLCELLVATGFRERY
jgi:hypothetical protein